MSYGQSPALQAGVYQLLVNDPDVVALVGAAIYDVVPSGTLPDTYVSLGPEDAQDRSDKSGRGADHRFVVSVVTSSSGFQRAKALASAISDALDGSAPAIMRGRVISIRFLKARARRVRKADTRRIDMTFRARVEDD